MEKVKIIIRAITHTKFQKKKKSENNNAQIYMKEINKNIILHMFLLLSKQYIISVYYHFNSLLKCNKYTIIWFKHLV